MSTASATMVGPFMREQILMRLREALRIARQDLSGQLDRFRTLMSGVVERLDGIDLTRSAEGGSAQPASRLPYAVLAAAGGEPVREFLLIPFGQVELERPIAGESFVFTRAQAESARRWFEQMGRKLAVDYEHQSFDRCNTRRDGLRPAAGWIGGLDVREDGLWAVEVTWTERAAELLRSGEYRYFSPVIFWTDEDHTDVAALGPVALTNDPAMRGVPALAAGRSSAEGALPEEDGEWRDVQQRLEEAREELGVLQRRLAAQEADTFVERGLRLGKILESTSLDWRTDYLRNPEAAEARLGRTPVLLPPGRVLPENPRGEVGRGARFARRGQEAGRSGSPAVEPEDLAAYERAAAVGRVLNVRG